VIALPGPIDVIHPLTLPRHIPRGARDDASHALPAMTAH
jgi:hypothetical protein